MNWDDSDEEPGAEDDRSGEELNVSWLAPASLHTSTTTGHLLAVFTVLLHLL